MGRLERNHLSLNPTRAEAYKKKTPAAWRIFWCYGPEPDQLTILAITKHP
jgi:hypothetical protein